MEDLLQPQIRESCKIALPNGLQDLMADISREVLRAQPQHLYQFIADYLAALLVARENLSVAARVCDDVCKAECWPELGDELRDVGLSDEDVETIGKVVMEFLQEDKALERNLLLRLLKKTKIEENQLPAILKAVRRAYLAHKLNVEGPYDASSDSDLNETTRAARHTVRLYRATIRPDEDYARAAEKIQAAYRAYRVRRKKREDTYMMLMDNTEKSIRFKNQTEQVIPDFPRMERCSSIASTVSLAGSYITLPPFTPYSNTYSDILDLEEDVEIEKERTNVDYDETLEIKKPRKPSVRCIPPNSLQEDEEVADEEIWEKVINDEDVEVVDEEINGEDKNVFNDRNETNKHEVEKEEQSHEGEILEKVMSMNHDEISNGAKFMVDSEVDDDDDDVQSCDLYSNKEFDYESSKESYTD